jgi:diketogulonate reductase-like aldo/keto reductase
VVKAYAPLARELRTKHPTIVSLSKKYSCKLAQPMIRWSLQHGFIPLPKSVTKERIEANGQISHSETDDADMRTMHGHGLGPSRRRFVPVNSPVNRTSFQSAPIGVCRHYVASTSQKNEANEATD